MIARRDSRLRRLKSTRFIIKKSNVARLCVHRTPRHIYAQIILPNASVVAAASSLSSDVKDTDSYTGNVDTAKKVGKLVAELAIAAGIKKVAFDRSGFKYHGRVKALADSAREAGLEF